MSTVEERLLLLETKTAEFDKPWYKKHSFLGSLGGVLLVLLIFLVNSFSDNPFLAQALHHAIGTDAIAAKLASNPESKLGKTIRSSMHSSLGTRPIIAYHSRSTIGTIPDGIAVDTNDCFSSSESPEQDCLTEGELEQTTSYIPFYANHSDSLELLLYLRKIGGENPSDTGPILNNLQILVDRKCVAGYWTKLSKGDLCYVEPDQELDSLPAEQGVCKLNMTSVGVKFDDDDGATYSIPLKSVITDLKEKKPRALRTLSIGVPCVESLKGAVDIDAVLLVEKSA